MAPAPKSADDIDEPATKRFKTCFDETITVLVGKDEIRFTIHKVAATSKSPYFANAVSEKWFEEQQGIIWLAGTRPEVFETYVHWLYTGHLPSGPSYGTGQDIPSAWSFLTRLWSLASHLGNSDLCNVIIDQTLDRMRSDSSIKPAINTLEKALTAADKGMARLMIDFAAWSLSKEAFEKRIDDWPPEVLKILAKKFMSGESRDDSNPLSKSRCYYHDHVGGEKCTKIEALSAQS